MSNTYPESRYCLRDIEEIVSKKFNLEPRELRRRSQYQKIVQPRQVIYFLAREVTALSLPQIGRRYGFDHSTVLSGVRRVRSLAAADPALASKIENCRDTLFRSTPYRERIAAAVADGIGRVGQ